MTSASNMQFRAWQLTDTQLPWSAAEEEDQRFTKLLRHGLLAFLVVGAVITLVPVPELSREQAERIPPQLARVILEKKELPEPPKPKPVEKKPVKKQPVEKKKPEPKPEPKPEVQPKPEKPPAARVELARQQAANSGLMQMQDELLAMRESVNVAEVSSGQLAAGAANAKRIDRSMISDRSKVSSGGVNTGSLSRDTGGVALAARETTAVKNTQASGAAREVGKKVRREVSARAEAAIRSVMEANKGAIFAIYNRALRRDPTLQGKVTVQLVIEANGSVSGISLVSSDLGDSGLERKLLARIRLINFGAANVEKTTLNYSIDFLPS